jgi:hypothetical protein
MLLHGYGSTLLPLHVPLLLLLLLPPSSAANPVSSSPAIILDAVFLQSCSAVPGLSSVAGPTSNIVSKKSKKEKKKMMKKKTMMMLMLRKRKGQKKKEKKKKKKILCSLVPWEMESFTTSKQLALCCYCRDSKKRRYDPCSPEKMHDGALPLKNPSLPLHLSSNPSFSARFWG